jgi:hypothetical protein
MRIRQTCLAVLGLGLAVCGLGPGSQDQPAPAKPAGETVFGSVKFDPEIGPLRDVKMTVNVIDTTAQGLPRPPILARRSRTITKTDLSKPLKFRVHDVPGPPDALYTVEIHVDRVRDGKIESCLFTGKGKGGVTAGKSESDPIIIRPVKPEETMTFTPTAEGPDAGAVRHEDGDPEAASPTPSAGAQPPVTP